MTKANRIETIIETETDEAEERITKQIEPIMKLEFNRLQKRFPKLKKVLFGNGTFYIDYGDKTSDPYSIGQKLPKEFDDFREMCGFAIPYMSEDLIAANEKKS